MKIFSAIKSHKVIASFVSLVIVASMSASAIAMTAMNTPTENTAKDTAISKVVSKPTSTAPEDANKTVEPEPIVQQAPTTTPAQTAQEVTPAPQPVQVKELTPEDHMNNIGMPQQSWDKARQMTQPVSWRYANIDVNGCNESYVTILKCFDNHVKQNYSGNWDAAFVAYRKAMTSPEKW